MGILVSFFPFARQRMAHGRLRQGRRALSCLTLLIILPAPFLRSQESPRFIFNQIMPETSRGQACPLVHCLIQDRLGFFWIAGPYGLARYDGNSFLFFGHREKDPTSLSDDFLFNVFEDSRGDIWVTSDKGLDLLDRKKGGFLHFRHDPADPRSLSSDHIRAICEDATGALWIGTKDGGVNRMDPETHEFTRFLHDPSDPNSPGSDAVWSLCRTADGRIWMGATEAGLDCYNPKSDTWSHFPYRKGSSCGPGDRHFWTILEGKDGRVWIGTNERGLFELDPSTGKFSRHHLRNPQTRETEYRILALREDREGGIWIGTDKAGLFRFDPKTHSLDRITAAPDEAGGLSDNTVMSIVEDREGLLWFGTGRGISILNKKRHRFAVVRPGPASAGGLTDGDVLSFYEDSDDVLWVGTVKGGIARWERKSGSWTSMNLNPEFVYQARKARVQAIVGDDRGGLWFGTSSGLLAYSRKAGAFSRYRYSARNPSLLPDSDITVLLRGRPGFLWVGTRNRGVFEWDIAGERARPLSGEAAGLLSDVKVNALCLDRRGQLWVGTQWNGLFRYDPDSGHVSEFGHREEDPTSLVSPTVYAIAEDATGRIWVGTQAGPCLFDAGKGAWTRLREIAGLSSRPVQGIVPDREGDVWLSSETDLVRIRLAQSSLRTYCPDDGLQGERFNIGAGLRLRNGEIVFGGTAGFNRFLPSKIVDNPYLPPLAVTGAALSFPSGVIQLLRTPETLDIPRSRFPITIYLSALSFSHSSRNRYRVRVPDEGNRIFELGTNRGFRLEALKPGRHRFVFFAANHDGVWNPEGVSLTLRVTVPFLQSWTGRGLFFALLALPAGFWLRRRARLRNRRLLHQIEGDLGTLGEHFDLTKREREILALILQGKSNKEIETALFISHKTVNNHIYNLYQKMRVRNRLALVNAVRDFATRKNRQAAR
jgi:ligand-binding sensor domain-containing protein/DNA-binding CsgD family transcriptional regulator